MTFQQDVRGTNQMPVYINLEAAHRCLEETRHVYWKFSQMDVQCTLTIHLFSVAGPEYLKLGSLFFIKRVIWTHSPRRWEDQGGIQVPGETLRLL